VENNSLQFKNEWRLISQIYKDFQPCTNSGSLSPLSFTEFAIRDVSSSNLLTQLRRGPNNQQKSTGYVL
jgi:hypothetical protein